MRFGGTIRERAATPLIVITFLSALAGGSAAAAGLGADGKFCIDDGSTMLLTRPGANGSLEFGMSTWNVRAHYFGVYGLAQPEAGGWRFRQNMNAADPEQRCEALIGRLPDGGYSFSVTQAGGCVADGGYGASPQPGQKILFPARSQQGALPPNKPMAEAMSLERGGVTCQKPHALPDPPATARPTIPCPKTYQGKSFLQVGIYDGPPERGLLMQPYQGDVAPGRNAVRRLVGWDRWSLNPKLHGAPDLHSYTIVCHYEPLSSGNGRRAAGTETNKVIVIEPGSGITQCYQYRLADDTSAGLTCTGGAPPIMTTPSDKMSPPPRPEDVPSSSKRP